MSETVSQIEKHALNIRRNILKMIHIAGSGHPAGSLGATDIFAALYFDIMKFNPKNPADPTRDILALSNGHIVPVQYATLAEVGAIKEDELWTLRQLGSRLQGHPVRTMMPWMELTSGPLGSGLSEAAGMALGLQARSLQFTAGSVLAKTRQTRSLPNRTLGSASPNASRSVRSPIGQTSTLSSASLRYVYCIVGDGELDEGNIWEGAMFANKYKLGNLITIVMRNNIQLDGDTEDVMPLEPLGDKWRSFGWHVLEVDGHNIQSIIDSTSEARAVTDKPSVIIAHTIPGKGVSFMEDDYKWHGTAPNDEELKKALEELR